MTARGKQVKIETLAVELEIFLYDRRILAFPPTVETSILLPKDRPPATYIPNEAPISLQNDATLDGWRKVFKLRRAWAIGLMKGSRKVVEGIHSLNSEIAIIRRGTAIAVENVKQHVGQLQPKFQESKAWADQTCEDQAFLLNNLNQGLTVLGSLPAYEDLGHCLCRVQSDIGNKPLEAVKHTQISLQDLVIIPEVRAAATTAEDVARGFSNRVTDMSAAFEDVVRDSSSVIEDFRQSTALSHSDGGSQVNRLMDEVEVIARKINSDCDRVLDLPSAPNSTPKASKIGHAHKTSLLPSLSQTNEEINRILVQTVERKEQASKASVQTLQEIAIVESSIGTVHQKLANLDVEIGNEQSFDLLNFVMRLPLLYGSLLVECVRRHEWSEKMTSDSSSLVEEMATYKEEEARRRKKWIKDMNGAVNLGSLDDMALGIEVNVQAQKQKWPTVSRNDITAYVQCMKELGDMDGNIKEMQDAFKSLDTPSKQQARRSKAFKNGSVHEAAYGRTSLLLRGDDEVLLAMRNDKSKLEDKLKSADSRIRKLEDLVHRQNQRPSSASGFPPSNGPTFERYTTSPVMNFASALSKAREPGSRRSSVSSRRFSVNNDPEEKSLAQRIVTLEAELTTEKAQAANLEKKAAARSNAEDMLRSQVREAISTKEDLLGNLEAQEREFAHERRLLEVENNKLKVKLEELEDDFDRVLDSREHDDRMHTLEEELEKLRNETAGEVQRALNQTENMRNDHDIQRERASNFEREVQRYKEENSELGARAQQMSRRLQSHEHAQADHRRALRSALVHSSHDEQVPENFTTLVEIVETVAEKAAAHLKDTKDALEALRADNASLETRVKSQGDEIYDLRERLGSEERAVFSLREELNTQQTQCATLQSQLDFERHEHNDLKSRFALGETDSESLRVKLTDGERMAEGLLRKMKDHEVQHQTLEGQLKEKEANLKALQSRHDSLFEVWTAQASRAVDVSTKLRGQNYLLEKLLEQVGLAVTRESGNMVIQKAPRVASASTLLNDPSLSMKRSLSAPMPTKNETEPLVNSEIPQWATADDLQTTERLFEEFMEDITSFDLDIFSEAIYKRVKEIEHVARKWQKEARAYRDKAHRSQGEAHDRIALRSFKEGDLALFLPTRDQATKPWAAFNVGAPHYFLREQDSHNLGKRDWLIARISKVEERVVDLSKSINGLKPAGDHASVKIDGDASHTDENPYELSDGLRWYLIDAAEEKPGAPINVGLGKATVASANVDAQGNIRMKKSSNGNGATKTLSRSLDSRRSSTNSKKGLVAISSNTTAGPTGPDGMPERSIDRAAAASPNLLPPQDTHRSHSPERPQSSQTLDLPAPGGPSNDHVGPTSASGWGDRSLQLFSAG
ncbi:MAG: oligomeric, coiled-coil, peripheral membrane protein [Alectoria fallacina]|uniref:Autophagy-related protein 11 n=1 Tax=Alectoria fallacina TaxID=1903189 RepID=A0A8H3INB7_9LECA|nr:MAG: oligomeric, coiled-coil, peripheral membrane protein [Alectoria fallacina]